MLLAAEGSHRQHTLDLLAREGIAPDRVTFVASQPRRRYLELYHGIDIGLDTVPYNGHTTSLDSFWMGVPVVTLVGATVVGRAGLCQLRNLGLPRIDRRHAGAIRADRRRIGRRFASFDASARHCASVSSGRR